MKRVETVETDYNRVEVWQNNAGRIDLEVSGATHATWHPTRLLTGHAWDAITAGVVSHPGTINSLLLLGLGGGTCLRQLRVLLPDTRMIAVEIDPEMIRLAKTYMGLDDLKVEVVETDAFDFLQTNQDKVDVVIDDLYHARGDDVERPKAITPGMLRRLCDHIRPGGSVVMNFVVGPGHDDVFQQACKSFQSVFPYSRRIIPPLSHNEILVGGTQSATLAGPKDLQEKGLPFLNPDDRNHWKDLRTLKLR